LGECVDELRTRIERLGAPEPDLSFSRKRLRLDIEVVVDLEVIGDEPNRAYQDVSSA